jgi:AcrR family transcriptional regulator
MAAEEAGIAAAPAALDRPARGSTSRAPRPNRAGRRPGNPDTRSTILTAAEAEFAAKGFDRVSMRGIAKAAGVDPALVHHYFDSKDDVLIASLDVPFDPRQVIPSVVQGGVDGLGARLASQFLAIWDEPDNQARLVTLVRASMSSEAAGNLLRDGLVRMIVGPISAVIPAPDAAVRAQFVASQMLGMGIMRYVMRVEPLASAPAADVVAMIGPTLQRYIDAAP